VVHTPDSAPAGDTHDWYRRSRDLLERGDANASLVLIDRVLEAEPQSLAAREIKARALFDSQHFAEAAVEFESIVEDRPDDDFAHYGLGMSLWRLQRFPEAADHLALARVMRPQDARYDRALTQVRATLRARAEADLPLTGPLEPLGPAPRPGSPVSDFWPEDPGPVDETDTEVPGPRPE
jgi:Flp pilus assembly protein TadD